MALQVTDGEERTFQIGGGIELRACMRTIIKEEDGKLMGKGPTIGIFSEGTQVSLSQKDVRWQAYSDAKYYADDGVRDSCQWPQVTRHDKVPDRQVEG